MLFNSDAANLVAGDANDARDVFLHDRRTGRTSLVSVGSAGEQGNQLSDATWLSWTGRYAYFQSRADNLVPADTNGFCDAFLRDLWRGTTERVSVGPAGAEGDECSFASGISGTGRFLLINTYASNLAPVGGKGFSNLLVKDRLTGRITVETVGPGGEPSNAASGARVAGAITVDGRWVAFATTATNMVSGDDNGLADVFRRDRRTGRTELVSVALDGGPANAASTLGAISADGNLVAFTSTATDLVPEGGTVNRRHVYLRDMRRGRTVRIDAARGGGEPNGAAGTAAGLSLLGRYVFFNSIASDLVAGDGNNAADSFVHDRWRGRTTLVSLGAAGDQGNANVFPQFGGIAPGGDVVTFVSPADNLVPGDVAGSIDVFVAPRRPDDDH